nr:MAG TPA: hypothetical protein [Caudoviricetes sp.]
MLIKKNDVAEKIKMDNALQSKNSIQEIQDALVELADLISTQDDALVELADILTEK